MSIMVVEVIAVLAATATTIAAAAVIVCINMVISTYVSRSMNLSAHLTQQQIE